jgi:tight adherence protein B
MPSAEMTMFSRTIRIQSQTGGNLVKVIEHLAATIKARRRLQRKIRAISAEGRASGWVIGMLPVGVAVILVVTQPDMRKAIFSTFPGHMSLIAMAVLEGIGAFIIASMLKIDV